MHHRLDHAIAVDLRGRCGIGQVAVFLQRQSVHVGAHQQYGAVAVAHHANDAGPANLLGHVNPADRA